MSRSKKFDFVKIRDHARDLRKEMTDSEKLLWKELRGRKLSGYKFLRQHPVLYQGNLKRYNYFIADFFCKERNVIIELDGPVHDFTREYDEFRDTELRRLGYKILRIKNIELSDLSRTLIKINRFLDSN